MAKFFREAALDNDGNADNQITDQPSKLYTIRASNLHASTRAYLHVYKAAHGDVTPGTTTPDATYVLEAAGGKVEVEPNVMSAAGWTMCASDAVGGGGSAVASVVVTATYG